MELTQIMRADTVKTLNKGAQIHFEMVEQYFSGQLFFIECLDYAFLLNSFGSTTATSDFDYSVYRLNLNGRKPSLMQEIDAIKSISRSLYLAIFLNSAAPRLPSLGTLTSIS